MTVLDISRLLPGGFASLLLQDLSARVIKVEQPGLGDYYRAAVPDPSRGNEILGGRQVHLLNHGKESLGLDLKSEEGRQIFKKLVRRADVVIESFRPGTLKRLGLDYPVLKKLNRRIILCSITGADEGDPLHRLAGHDLNYLGLSGLLFKIRDRDGRPVVPDFQIVDLAAGQAAAGKILAALYRRVKGGKGCRIVCSLLGTARLLAGLYPVRQRTFLGGGLMRYGIYETADGHFVTLAPLEHKFWRSFCEAVGHPEWGGDPLASGVGDPAKEAEIRRIIRSKGLDEWTEIGRRIDCCLFPVGPAGEAPPASSEKIFSPLGTHTGRILRSLGYGKKGIADLRSKGVVA